MLVLSVVALVVVLYRIYKRPDLICWLSTGVFWLSSVVVFYAVTTLRQFGYIEHAMKLANTLNDWSTLNQIISVVFVTVLITYFGRCSQTSDVVVAIEHLEECIKDNMKVIGQEEISDENIGQT